jgi:hypothetical protein
MHNYPWLAIFQRAQTENDVSQLSERVLAAEGVMVARGQELRNGTANGPESKVELQALREAMSILLRIKTDPLK